MLRWNDKIKKSKKLTVFGESVLESGPWRGLLTDGMKIVNHLLRSHGIHCEFVPETKEKSNIEVDLASGAKTWEWRSKKGDISLTGTDLHGLSFGIPLHEQRIKAENRADHTMIFLPSTPMALNRAAGRNGLTWILCHELVHSVGLDDTEHSMGDQDLFAERGIYVPSDDQVAGTKGGKQVMMPPFFLSVETLRNLHLVW
jgi:hypothetical protein